MQIKNMLKKEISIIIPCYNCSETLEEAVESCFAQGLKNFEIVMVDDKSTDTTKEVMQKLADNHPEIKLFYHDKNMGGGATRNTAVENSEADVIFCLDSDDILPQGTLFKMLSFMGEKKCDGVGIHHSIKFNGANKEDIDHVDTFGYAGERIPFESLIQKNNIYCPLYSTFMHTRRAFEVAGGYPTEHGFDTQGFAWRFLSSGLTAYTCPDASYLHRIRFKESYYIREYNSGKVNYNWQDVLSEHLSLFNTETQNFILNFDCVGFSRNLFEELCKKESIFKENYEVLLEENHKREKIIFPDREYIKRASLTGVYMRIKNRFFSVFSPNGRIKNIFKNVFCKLRVFLRKYPILRRTVIHFYVLVRNIRALFKENHDKKAYYRSIEKIKENKKIVLDIQFGGLGDWLVFTSLPRLLKETYDVDFFLSQQSLSLLRNNDTYKICFEMNPYFQGISDDLDVFQLRTFSSEMKLWNFLTDLRGENIVEILERQFQCKDAGLPEIYYKPKNLKEYENIILVDKNYISGVKLGWHYNASSFEREIKKEITNNSASKTVEYVDTSKQDLFIYADMIYSCNRFITVLSGGAALAACFKKPFTAILPYDVFGGSVEQFVFKESKGVYVR